MSASRRMWASFALFMVFFVVFDSGSTTYHWSRGLVWSSGIASAVAFLYAMYVFYFDVTRGDRHLQKSGIKGTAVVLSAKQTRAMAQTGQFDFQAPFIWKYRLRVTIPGKDPYEASCGIARDGIREVSTVQVAVSRFSRRSVTILAHDLRSSGSVSSAGGGPSNRQQRLMEALQSVQSGTPGAGPSWSSTRTATATPGSAVSQVDALAKLSDLHQAGALTAEFAAEKARILNG